MVSILGILSGATPLMVDVRQTGSRPISDASTRPWRGARVASVVRAFEIGGGVSIGRLGRGYDIVDVAAEFRISREDSRRPSPGSPSWALARTRPWPATLRT